MISEALAQEFRRICHETLGFLTTYGFSDARLSWDPSIQWIITARFYGKRFAIECIWDNREEHLDAKVARLRDGKPSEEFAVDSNGQRVRDLLTSILLRRVVRGFGFRKLPPGMALPERWRSQLEDYARLLQQHGDAVLREAPDVLA